MSTTSNTPNIVIVGGALAGLTLALACAARGLSVHVVERSPERVHGGDSLSVDLGLVAATVGYDPRVDPKLPVVPAYRELSTWAALYGWLRDRATSTPGITLETGMTVTEVANHDDQALIKFADNSQRVVDAVIGADGYNSVVRKAIAPEAPYALYAGYLVWRGLVEEQHLSRPVAWPSDGGLWIEFVDGYRLVAATLPGRDGSVVPGKRQITFAWFDTHQDDLLRNTGCLTADGHIVGTLGRGTISQTVRDGLRKRVSEVWPDLWAEAVALGVMSIDVLSGAPIAEYKPVRLVSGGLAIIGDAAHVISPMTGRGFLTGVEDAAVLASLLADRPSGESVVAALAGYEMARLPFVRGLVTHSSRISADYVKYATSV